MLRGALGLAGGMGYRRLRNRRYPVRGAPAVLAAAVLALVLAGTTEAASADTTTKARP